MPISLDLTNIEDLVKFRSEGLLSLLFVAMSDTIKNGDTVIIERRYTNAPPEIVTIITTKKELYEYGKHWLSFLPEE